MWIRSAFWVGSAGRGFRAQIESALVPALRLLPGVSGVKALWPERREDSPPDVALQILVEYDSFVDLERMLASPERHALRDRVNVIASDFQGSISHIDYEVGK